ncbi:glycosyl hydrolase 108 family protein [Flavimaribacter sediminis]|uniref:glycosyl hydrolase 108 family protein n=1 Tax=Flavimaribacter sediminis TaxID=2865987 RepID=UPI00215D7B51|nr:glycosyl hydrolase 108 family protein [Flavimaribacter sediminis]
MTISKADRFNICHAITAKLEGGGSNHAADPGGKTMYGVTEATAWLAKRKLPMKPVSKITYAEALRLYRDEYWQPTAIKYNLVPGVDLAVYDAAVNSSVSRGLKWLKASVGSSDHTVTARDLPQAAFFHAEPEDLADLRQGSAFSRSAISPERQTWPEIPLFTRTFGRFLPEIKLVETCTKLQNEA